MVRKERSFISRFKYDIVVLVCVLLGGVAYYIHQNPFSFDGEDAEVSGETPPQIGIGETLLVVPDVDAEASSFGDMDFSFAWYNALAQEIGPSVLQVSGALAPEDLAAVHLVVVPTRAAVLLESPQIAMLQRWVEAGGSLIVEMPGPSWSQLTGVTEPVLVGRSAKAITAADASALQGEYGKDLLDVPLTSRILRLDTVELPDVKRGDILLEIDGVPVHYRRPLGEGHVYVVGFDFGMAVTALQQGVPEVDMTIAAVPGEEDDEETDEDEILTTTPDMLVAHPKLRQAMVPYADLLERHVLYAPLRHRPAVRLWVFPDTMSGAVIMTHEERGFGDRGNYMAEHEARIGLTGTYLVSPSEISNDGLDALAELGADVGIGWHRNGDAAIYESRGVGRFKPYRVALNLAEQKERLESWAARRIYAARVHDLVWDRAYNATFRKLAAAGLYIDTSYGPSTDGEYGYLFGTGLPFYPIDDNGLPLPVYEFPFVMSDAAGFGPTEDAVPAKMLEESRKGYHNLLTFDIDADAMGANPRPNTLSTWLDVLKKSTEEKHWVTNLAEYTLFYDGRRQAMVHSDFDPETRTLTADVDIPLQTSPRDDAPLPAPALSVPMRYDGETLESVTLDGQVVELNTLGRTGDGVLALIPTTAGAHRLEVRWQAR